VYLTQSAPSKSFYELDYLNGQLWKKEGKSGALIQKVDIDKSEHILY